VVFSGCVKPSSGDYKSNPKSVLTDEISKKVFLQLKQEKNLYPCECGAGLTHEDFT
jgi:hypothetical protein